MPQHDDMPEEPVDGAALLDEITQTLEQYVVFPVSEEAWTVALWVLHTHVYETFGTTPYLHVKSPTKQAGKSRLFDVLSLLVARPWKVVGATEAVLFRKIERDHPTLLLDEVDSTFGRDPTQTQGIRGVLNAGFCVGATIPRLVGPNHEPADFDVYCPKAFSGIGSALPDTLADRSIPIELRRRAPYERQPDRFRHEQVKEELAPLKLQSEEWALAHSDEIQKSQPELPDHLTDRQQDAWEVLLAIADLAGGPWPGRARQAARVLHSAHVDGDNGVLLLAHLRAIFLVTAEEHLLTHHMLTRLIERDDGPWASLWSNDMSFGRTLGPARAVAKLLAQYGIKSRQFKQENGGSLRGFHRTDFADAWGRYLPGTSTGERDGLTVSQPTFLNHPP